MQARLERPRETAALRKKLAKPEDSPKDQIADRHHYIEQCMSQGGKPFVDRVRRYGATDKGEPLRMDRWFCELLEAIGDFRIPHTLVTGNAQQGKTASHSLLLTDVIVHGKLNAGWFYSSRDSRNLNVPEQFYPVVEKWLEKMAAETGKVMLSSTDRQNTSRYQVDGATAIFSYTSTSKQTPSRAGLAAAGGAAVSFTANVLFFEERSQWVPGSADPLPRRLDASLIPTRPIRELGTPGAGQGIESEVERADYWFYPFYQCSNCKETLPLDPKGCLLKRHKRKDFSGKEVEVYLSLSGRPVHWWHADSDRPVESAYIACSNCGHPIANDQRQDAWMQCRKTGITLREFLDGLSTDSGYLTVALHISPLCRITKNNLASELIRGGINAVRSEDWQQQALGHPSENTTTSVSLDMLKAAIAAPRPTTEPTWTLAGVDQGRGEDWLWLCDYHLPDNWRSMPINDVMEQTIRVVQFGGDVVRSAIRDKLIDYGVLYGLIDNEPNISNASDLCGMTDLEMANQRSGLKDAAKRDVIRDGGIEYPCWQIRNEKFLNHVLLNFATSIDGYPLYRLPDDWRQWFGVSTERSPIRHLMAPSYNPDSGKWNRGEGHIDDLYYAAMFCEAAFYLLLEQNQTGTFAQNVEVAWSY